MTLMAICQYHKNSGVVEIATSGVPVLYMENEKNYNLLKINGLQNSLDTKVKIENIKLNSNKGDKLILHTDGLANQINEQDKKKTG